MMRLEIKSGHFGDVRGQKWGKNRSKKFTILTPIYAKNTDAEADFFDFDLKMILKCISAKEILK